MKIALVGNGAMGQLVACQARAAGDEVGVTLDSAASSQSIDELVSTLRGHDVAIDFSTSAAVMRTVEVCARASVPLVEGTTGWGDQEKAVREIVETYKGTLVYGANFSIGVNVFYKVVSQAAKLFSGFDQYEVFIEEQHHSRKRDKPSGTALKLRSLINESIEKELSIASTRAGQIPGTHRVGFDSAADQILLTHMARSREGFAAGALLAARWVIGKTGVYEFSDVIEDVMK